MILFEEQAFIEAAHDFFSRLRDLDNEGVDLILAGALSDKDGVGIRGDEQNAEISGL